MLPISTEARNAQILGEDLKCPEARAISLDGAWTLKSTKGVEVPEIPAQVPGNIELDLQKAGILPDLFYGHNINELEKYEFNSWEYAREFEVPADFPANADLDCDGIFCLAVIDINGQLAGKCDNSLIRHVFPVGHLLKRGESNTIRVTISSPLAAVKDIPLDHQSFCAYPRNFASLNVRVPGSAFGTGATPRMILGGIIRSIGIVERPAHRLTRWYMDTHPYTTPERGVLACSFSMSTDLESWDEFTLEMEGRCGEHRFTHRQDFNFPAAAFFVEVKDPQFWYPTGYGPQNLYEVEVRISHRGQELCRHRCTFGLRTVKIEIDDNPEKKQFDADYDTSEGVVPWGITPETRRFSITVNGLRIMVKGFNWMPSTPYHSQAARRCLEVLPYASELRCNTMRVWGGGMYEPPEFYDYCDRHGILIWQDFAMSCEQLPQHEEMLTKMRVEAESAVLALRQHPCLLCWCGDNEVDVFQYEQLRGVKPSMNLITRQIIPQVLNRLDPSRCYMPSGPQVSLESEKLGRQQRDFADQHPWGPRDWYKEPHYQRIKANLVSELGFYGMCSEETLRKFMPAESLWPAFNPDNADWQAHAPQHFFFRYHELLRNARECFPEEYKTLADFIDASQAVHAEGFKFLIEKVRSQRWQHSGYLLWDLTDCWPQQSEAPLDYYLAKKPGYYYIRRSQAQSVMLCFSEWDYYVAKGMGRRGHMLICCNDSLEDQQGSYRVTDGDTGELLLEGRFSVKASSNDLAAHLDVPHVRHRLLLIEWKLDDGTRGANHYICGNFPFTLEEYRRWLPKIQSLDEKIDW